VSKNANAQPSANWQVMWALRHLGFSTPDQIAIYTGLDESSVNMAIGVLRRKGLIEEK